MADPSARVMLVTALFDVPARESNQLRRSVAEYFRHGELILGLDQDIVFFVDPYFADSIRERRAAHGLLHRSAIIPVSLEELPYYALRDQLAAALRRNPVVNAVPSKETPLYRVVTWSKYTVARWAMERDPFGASHLAWVDFGIAHFGEPRYYKEDRAFEQATERVKLLMVRPFGPRDVADLHTCFTVRPGTIAGSMFSGSRPSFERLSTLFDAEIRAAVELGYAPADEQVLPRLCMAAPDLFEYCYGNYDAFADNRIVIRSGAPFLWQMMHIARAAGDYARCCDIGARVLASHRAGTLDVDPACLSSILDEYFVAAFHLEAPEQRTAREIAEYYAALVRRDRGFAEAFCEARQQILADFSFLKEPVHLVGCEAPAAPPMPRPSIADCEEATRRGQTMIWAERKLARGGTPEELWAAHYLLAVCYERLDDEARLLEHALAAYERWPQRAEPLYLLAKHHRLHGRYVSCLLFAEPGARIPHPGVDAPLLDAEAYRTGFAEEMRIARRHCQDGRREARGCAGRLERTTSRSDTEERGWSPVDPRVMLVTALFDLPARESNRHGRSVAEYFRHGELLFGLDQDIVFFVDPCFADSIRERRAARGLLDRTAVIPVSLEELPYYALREQLAAALRRNPVLNAAPSQETPLHRVVTWSKFALAQWAMERDPFGANHVTWVDFGIAHWGHRQHCEKDRVFEEVTERIKLMVQWPFDARDAANPHLIFRHAPSHVATCCISGSRSSFERLCALFDAEARAALALGYAPTDEQVLSRICASAPDLFEYYYGHPNNVFDNKVVTRGGAPFLIKVMKAWRALGDYARCCDIGARLLASHRAGTLGVESECILGILEHYFVAAFHLEAPEQRTAHGIAEYYAALVQQDPGSAEVFRRTRQRVLTSFSFLEQPVFLGDDAEVRVPKPSIASCEDARGREQTMIWAELELARAGTPEELWAAHYLLAVCHERSGDGAKLIEHALAAYELRPLRAEPLYLLARHHRLHGRYEACMLFAELGARMAHPGPDAPLLEENVYQTGFAEEMSIAGFYCHDERHKAQGYAACLGLMTSRSASDESRRLALRNSSYYARSAEQLFGEVLLEELEVPGAPAEISLCLHEGALRCVVSGGGGPSHFLTLEESCLEPSSCDCELHDARLLSSRGRLWCVGWSEGGAMNMVELDGACRVVGVQSGGHAGTELKGWVPLLGEEPLQFIASTDPTVVVGAGEHHRSVPPLWLEGLRGASQAVALEQGWLYVGREELELESGRRQLHRFVLLDRGFKLLGLSAPFYFLGQGMERCGGLVRDEAHGLLVASFSAGKGRACLASFVEKTVLARLYT